MNMSCLPSQDGYQFHGTEICLLQQHNNNWFEVTRRTRLLVSAVHIQDMGHLSAQATHVKLCTDTEANGKIVFYDLCKRFGVAVAKDGTDVNLQHRQVCGSHSSCWFDVLPSTMRKTG